MLSHLSDLLWGVPGLVLFLAVGIALTVVTRGVQFRRLGASVRQVVKSLRTPTEGVSPFQAVCTALAATVGTGNIAGVAGAIALGGPGAVFWMWAAAFLGMATKYAEVVLAMQYRKNGRGGPMYYMEQGLGSRKSALFFSAAAVAASFGMGNMAQTNTIASAVQAALPHLPQKPLALLVGLMAAGLVAAVTVGGAKRVGQVMELLVPVVAAAYLLGGLWVIAAHWREIPHAFAAIFSEAFSPRAAIGGGMGAALRYGVSRGVFSNEAGLGSAPLAYAESDNSPEEQGLLGIFEVFFDTVVLCTVTALALLVSGIPIPYGSAAGAELASAALETVFGSHGAGLLAVCLSLLALATLISWQLYGVRCAQYLLGEGGGQLYRLLHIAVIVIGAVMELSLAWAISDLCNALMAIPNLIALFLLRKSVAPQPTSRRTAKALRKAKRSS